MHSRWELMKAIGKSESTRILRRVFLGMFMLFWTIPFGLWALDPPHRWTRTPYPVSFEHISVEQGLSQSIVTAILQDRQGFLWFGTQGGLNRYDGFRFRVFQQDKNDPNSLGSSWITCLLEDRKGFLWIGTNGGGLSRLDPASGLMNTYRKSIEPGSLASDNISSLVEDHAGNIWIAATTAGLCMVPASSAASRNPRFETILPDSNNPNGLPSSAFSTLFIDGTGTLWISLLDAPLLKMTNPSLQAAIERMDSAPEYVTAMQEDSFGCLWLASPKGLSCLSPDRQTIHTYTHSDFDANSQADGLVYRLYRDHANVIWVGHDGGGLSRMLDRKRFDDPPRFRRIVSDPTDPHSLVSNAIEYMYEDTSGVFWVSTYQTGLNKLVLNPARPRDRETPFLFHYRSNIAVPGSLVGNVINTITEDRFGNLWVGTDGSGLHRASPSSGPLRFEHFGKDNRSLNENVITTSFMDSRKQLWLGTYQNGLVRVDQSSPDQEPQFTHFRANPKDPTSLSTNFMWAILEDPDHHFWIGHSNGCIDVFDPDSGKVIRRFLRGSVGVDTANIYSMARDDYGTIWVGTTIGLHRINPANGQVRLYKSGGPGSLGDVIIHALRMDSEHNLWIGTHTAGMYRCIPPPWDGPAPCFTHFGASEGLTGRGVNAILEDRQGQLWVTTDRSICRFDPKTCRAYPFPWQESLRKSEFIRTSAYRSASGEMLFGSNNGLYIFDPAEVAYNLARPPIAITDFQIAGNSIRLQERLSEDASKIVLRPKDTMVSFDFAALHFVAPDRNEYAYMMEGLDTEWHSIGNRHFITYTTLPPGHYKLRIRGANCDGQMDPAGLSFSVRVLPPWYKTWWFYLISILTGALSIYAVVRLRIQRLTAMNQILESRVVQRTEALRDSEKRAQEASRAKSTFLASMSHELRTPLNAILGYAQLLARASRDPETKENLGRILRAGEHLLGLLNNVLSISKIEAGKIVLEPQPFATKPFFKGVEDMIGLRARDKGLEFVFQIQSTFPEALLGDAGRLRQVLLNLLGNAIKFTQQGQVGLLAELRDDNTCFEVWDTGPGMSADDQTKLFQAFEQTQTGRQSLEGTGLGLHISKALIEHMGGTLTVTSEEGVGTRFHIEVPLPRADAPPAEEPIDQVIGLAPGQLPPKVLVVDDVEDNRVLMAQLFRGFGMEVSTASDGVEAVEMWEVKKPEIIWMDVRMPRMNGLEATKKIRSLETERHLPRTTIVALTASAMDHNENALEEAGLDDWVFKPFRERELFEKFRQYLGTEFLHESAPSNNGGSLDPEQVRELPDEWQSSFRESVAIGDLDEALRLLEELQNPDIARHLETMLREYRIQQILNLFTSAGVP